MLNEACRSRSTTYFSEEWWHAWVKGDKKYANFFDFQSIRLRSRYIIYGREGGVKRPFALYYTDHVMYWKMDPIIYDFLINKMQKKIINYLYTLRSSIFHSISIWILISALYKEGFNNVLNVLWISQITVMCTTKNMCAICILMAFAKFIFHRKSWADV